MALSRLRIEAQKEREEEEKKREEPSGQVAGTTSRLRQEAQKEREENPDRYKRTMPTMPGSRVPQGTVNPATNTKDDDDDQSLWDRIKDSASFAYNQVYGKKEEKEPSVSAPQTVTDRASLDKLSARIDELTKRQSELTPLISGARRGGLTEERRRFEQEQTANREEISRLKDELDKARPVFSNDAATQKAENLTNLEKTVQELGSVFEKEQTEDSYNRYMAAYQQYSQAVDDYNAYMDYAKSDASGWEIAGDTVMAGIGSVARGIGATMDFILPAELWDEKDPLSKFINKQAEEAQHLNNEWQESIYGRSGLVKGASEIGKATVEAIPNAILALMSGGTSVAAQGTTAALQAATTSTSIASTIGTVANNMARNPMYWSSMVQTLGPAYEEAKENGASEWQASATAMISSMLNAGVEVSGGIELLPAKIKSGNTNAVLEWVLSTPEEGVEEVIQRFISGTTDKVIYDHDKEAFSFTNPDAIVNPKEMGKEFAMGTAVGGILGGAQIGGISAANSMINRINNRKLGQIGGDYQASAEELIEEGLTFAPETEAYQAAAEVKAKMDAGEAVSDADLGRVVVANERTIQREERNAASSEYSQRVEDVLEENDTRPAQEESVAESVSVAESDPLLEAAREVTGAKSVPYNVMATSNPERQQRIAETKSIQEITGYGEHGASAFTSIVEDTGADPGKVRMEFQSAYEAGRTGLSQQVARLDSNVRLEAYNAGRLDAIMAMNTAKEKAQGAVIRKDAGFDQVNLPTDVTRSQAKAVDLLAKATGVKVRMAKGLKGNAEIAADGTVLIDESFEREVNGKKRSIVFYAAHEIGMHRLMQLAPDEGQAFINSMIQDMNKDLPYGATTVSEKKRAQYAEQNVSLDIGKAMEEVAADSILSLYDNEATFYEAIDRIVNGKDEKAKQGAKKFKEILDDIVKKLKAAIAKLTGKEKAEVQQTLTEVEQLRDLFEKGLAAATKRAKTVAESENGTKNAAQTGDGKVQFALKNVNGKQVVWIENSALTSKQLANHNAVAAYIAQHIGEVYTIIESGQKVYIGSDLPGEYTQSRYTDSLRKRNPGMLKAKNKATSELGLLIETATNRRWEKTKHTHSKDAKYGMYRYDSSFAFPVKNVKGETTAIRVYDTELLIRNAADGKKYLYDIVGIKENTTDAIDLQNREARLAAHKAASHGSASEPNVAQQEVSVKRQAEELSDKGTEYSLRTKEPPKKVGIAYKVFFAKNGQLYPPMVPNPGGAGTPVGVWLDADIGESAGVSKTGRPQVKAGGKGTQGGGGTLAFRPGWHLGDLPMATQFNRVNPETGKKELVPANFVWAECEYAMDHDYQEEAMSYGYTENGKFRHAYAGLPKLPEDGYYRYRTNPNPDTVPWVITGAMRVKRILTDAETDQILRDAGVEPLKRQGGPADLEKMGIKAGAQFSLKDQEMSNAINQSMTMQQAKDMIQRAFILGEIKQWFDGQYKNGDEWARGEGAADVAVIVDNEWSLQEKFLNKIPGVMDGDFYAEDIIEAYLAGTLVGKQAPTAKRMDTSKDTEAKDSRFYAPNQIENAKAAYEVALQKVTNKNREAVYKARADIIMFAHTKGAAEELDLTQSEMNKKLSSWARYNARARETSERFNQGVADWNKWTGIENSNILSKASVSNEDLDRLVGEITGDSDGWQRKYIMRTMLALDTHIDYTGLNFRFVGQPDPNNRNVNGLYSNGERTITVKHNAPHTVAHEMGHYLDYQWARDVGVGGALTERFGRNTINDPDVKQWVTNFDIFKESLEDAAVLHSGYTMDSKEVFARFVDRFVLWVNFTANGEQDNSLRYNDKFTAKHYIEFVRLLQEKAVLDGKKQNGAQFSLKEHNDLLAENAKLKEVNQGLRDQFKTTQFAKVDKKALRDFSKQLLKDYSSGADIDETRDALDGLYTYLANGEDGLTPSWNEAYKRAYEVAVSVLDNATTLDDEMWRTYKDLRDRLRNVGISISPEHASDLMGYENLQDFRQRNFGRLKIVKNGTPVDSLYAELANAYPELFDEDRYNNQGDQLVHIADVLEEMKPIEINPYRHDMREAATWLANDIMERFFELPQAKPTFADKAEQKLTKQAIKDAKKLEKLREQKNQRIAQIIADNREKVKQTQTKERTKREEAVKQVKEHYKAKEAKKSESQKAREMRAKILRHTTELSKKLLRASDKNHIPQELQGAVAKLLESINLESNYTYDPKSDGYKKNDLGTPTMRSRLFANLRKIYGDLANELTIDPDLLGDDGLLAEVIGMADLKLADMTLNELDTVWKAIRAIEASVMSANIAFNKARLATISEAAETLRMDNFSKKEKVELDGPGGMLGKAQKLTGLDMMTPESYFHRLGKSGDNLFRMMRDAQDDHIRKMKEVSDFTHEALKGVNVRKLENQMHTVQLGERDVQMSTAQIMEMYVLMRREQARDHIMVGGILPDVVSKGGIKKVSRAKPVRGVQLSEMANAFKLLTDEQIQIAEKLQEYASTELSKWGNEAAMKVYNYEKFGEKTYWPIRVNRQETQSNVQKDTQVTSVAGRGFTKGTKPHANNSVMVGSIFDTFSTHASEMATYAAWLATMEDINRIRNFTFKSEGTTVDTVKGIIDTVHGKAGTAYLSKLLADLSNGVKGTHGETNYMSGLVGNYKAASVGANLRVIIQQPTALLRALDMLNPQYLVAGMKPTSGWKKALKYAPIAQWKDWGYFDINTGRQMKDVLFDSDSVLNKVKNVSMWGAGKADSLSWGLLWNAVEAETKHKRKDLEVGTEEFYEAVAERFNEIVDHTQVVDGILQRSQIMRSADGLTKMATSFMGEPTKQYNMMMSAVYDITHGNREARRAGKRRFMRSSVALLIAGVVNAAAQAIMDAVRDDDKEKDYWEKWLAAFTGVTGEEETLGETAKNAILEGNLGSTLNPATYIPYVKDVVSIIQGYDVTRMDMESIEKTLSASQNLMKALNGEGKYTLPSAMASLFAEVARVAGVPVANLKREVKSFAMLSAAETDNYLLQYRMEKMALSLNYSGNSGTFMDILFNAYQHDRDAYEIIYADMIASGYDAEKLANGMETRMKKAQGVNKVDEMEQRFLHPDQQASYDKSMAEIRNSGLWRMADDDQQDAVEEMLYNLAVDNSAGQKLQEKIDGGAEYGIDEEDYLLYKLALSIVDEPTESGKLGSYTQEEATAAIEMLMLDDDASGYLWQSTNANWKDKNNPWR